MNNLFGSDMWLFIGIIAASFFFLSFFSVRIGLVLLIFSMIFSPEFSVGYIGIRPITIRIEDVLIPVLVIALIARSSLNRQFQLFGPSPLNRPIGLLLAVSIISTLWGIVMWDIVPLEAAFFFLKTVEFFIVYFLTLNFVKTEKQIRSFLFFAIITVGLVGLYTLTQVPSVKIFTVHRITAPFEGDPEPGTVGGYMAFLIVIVISMFLYEPKRNRRWFYGILLAVLMIPFLFTLSRSSYAALALGILFITVIERKRKWLVRLTVCLLLTAPFWLPGSVKDRIAFTWRDAKNPGRTMGVDSSFESRFQTFEKMWRTLKRSPVIGWGVSSFQTPDSQYARTLHEIGIIGMGIWIWIFLRLFRMSRWLFNYLDGGALKGLVLGYQAGLIGILMHAFGSITFYIVRIMEPFWFITGLVVSLYMMKVREASILATGEDAEESEEELASVV